MKKNESRKLGATTSLGSQEALGTLGRDMKRRGFRNAVGAGLRRREARARAVARGGGRLGSGDRDQLRRKKRHARVGARGKCPLEKKKVLGGSRLLRLGRLKDFGRGFLGR